MSRATKAAGKGLLIDTTKCVGCGACYFACKQAHGLSTGDLRPLDDELSDQAYTVVRKAKGRYVRRLCWHCESPTCASVCPVKALEKSEEGPVVYHEDRCMGCRYCMQACPFGVPKYEWKKRTPHMRKCDLCVDRVRAGGPTACAQACPTGATKFGARDELIEEARGRIRAEPGKYHDHIYGLEDLGGSSVLMISDVPLETLGAYPSGAGRDPLPLLTLQVLHKIPYAVGVGGVLLGGICWITRRRMQIEEEAARKREGKLHEGGGSVTPAEEGQRGS